MKKIALIVARDDNNVIGHGLSLPGWGLVDDFKENFVPKTKNNPIIMGSKTAQSLGKPLKHRTNIVLSKDPASKPLLEGFMVVGGMDAAVLLAENSPGDTIWIIGGAQIYDLAIRTLPITEIHISQVIGLFPAENKSDEIVFDFFPELHGYALDPHQSRNFKKRDPSDNDRGNSHDFRVEVWVK